MNEPRAADGAPHASGSGPPRAPRRLAVEVNPDSPPHAREATAAFIAEYDELLAHAAAHPGEDWVAYRGGQRVGFGTDDLALWRECQVRFPDGLFQVYYIDPILQYPDDTVV